MSTREEEMRAVTIDRFGGPEVLAVRTVPRPKLAPNQIMIRVESAGIGIWDVAERDGTLARALGIQPIFPWVLGSEGAGRVVEVGDQVTSFRNGDLVYGHVWMRTNPKAGFYAEDTALNADDAWPTPSTISAEQAGALLIDGATALRGLEALGLKQDEKLMVFGASGGIGHLAVQLGKRLGARVFAIASGEDGVDLALRLGAEVAADGHKANLADSAHEFAPNGFDAALIAVRGQSPEAIKAAENALTTMREGGRVAYPWSNDIMPAPKAPPTVRLHGYMGNIDRALVIKLNGLIDAGPFEVHLGETFTLDRAADAYNAVRSHHLGRLALLPAS
jgi:NADPH2:quinone reductase